MPGRISSVTAWRKPEAKSSPASGPLPCTHPCPVRRLTSHPSLGLSSKSLSHSLSLFLWTVFMNAAIPIAAVLAVRMHLTQTFVIINRMSTGWVGVQLFHCASCRHLWHITSSMRAVPSLRRRSQPWPSSTSWSRPSSCSLPLSDLPSRLWSGEGNGLERSLHWVTFWSHIKA